jgi:uncharacterized protein
VKFWDSSALVPLLVREAFTGELEDLYTRDDGVFVWWGTAVECASAIARLERQAQLETDEASELLHLLDEMERTWQEIPPIEPVREAARRFLRAHDLHAADALQLAAAYVASENRPRTLSLVCLDTRLGEAAQREGFKVIGSAQLQGRHPVGPAI